MSDRPIINPMTTTTYEQMRANQAGTAAPLLPSEADALLLQAQAAIVAAGRVIEAVAENRAANEREQAQAATTDARNGSQDVTPVVVVLDVLGGVDWARGFQWKNMHSPEAKKGEAYPLEMAALGWLPAEQTHALVEEVIARLEQHVGGDLLLVQRIAGWRLRLGEMMGRG